MHAAGSNLSNVRIVQTSKVEDDNIVQKYKEINPWGMNVSIDIYGCDVELIKSEEYVKNFLKDLVTFIGMKAYGEPLIKNFGPNPRLFGISALQLIETSSITAHFAPDTKAAHIDIFSCTSFRPHAAGVFCRNYFKATELIISDVVFRY
ncbi:MAG: hypothetical protein A3F40_04675 [Chlamydiae bacterium RIFCSPHIGHO2_12_FULL_27_8]|nr:MAG: hypothetical protein A3F40_04675 [Chlamydiae bacterium RIFCSPHIGHO2_12_FULL_27_8]OGN66392.1 MAG: hypothetical protein A2888_02875 [Chlamydiae bacterium RIFCSPLOWO2_01_FULL_28_7]